MKAKIEKLAEESGAELRYIAQIRNEPYIEDIFRCMDEVREFEPDMILAIGGGSVLDTAKAIHLFYENPEMSFEEATIPYALPALGKKAVMLQFRQRVEQVLRQHLVLYLLIRRQRRRSFC